jgi:hypothetical protein
MAQAAIAASMTQIRARHVRPRILGRYRSSSLPRPTLITFFALTFGLSRGILALLIAFTAQVAALFHFQVNGPAWPDAQPWDSAIFAVLAALTVAFNRKHCFDKTAGAVEILAPSTGRHESAVKPA